MKYAVLIALFLTFGASVKAQAVCPEGLVCLSQSDANKAAQNARELDATKAKVTVLESALVEKDKSIAEVQKANTDNTAKLTEALHETENKLATATGQIIELKADKVQSTAIIQYLLTKGTKRCTLSIICL